jgi:hypothetical protein
MLLLAACTGAAEDTTTTAPLTEPSTTSTTTPTTSTTTEATTTTMEECTEREGVLRTRRGFVCPPTLGEFIFSDGPDLYLPGVYQTRAFHPALRFARTTTFTTFGEHAEHLVFDLSDHGAVSSMSGPFGDGMASLPEQSPTNAPEGWSWVTDSTSTAIEIDDVPATRTDFTADCDFPRPQEFRGCEFLHDEISTPGLPVWHHLHNDRVTYIRVHHSIQEFTIIVEANQGHADTYWTEVAQPILDSIEFLDP